MEYRLTTPCTAQDLAPLKAGDTVLLSGVVYTARDQAHKRMMEALDKGENLRRDICLSIEEMGLQPEHSHHESGPGQNEVCFRYAPALKSADNLNTFKSAVKAIAARNGL